jgi:hypothetical protein
MIRDVNVEEGIVPTNTVCFLDKLHRDLHLELSWHVKKQQVDLFCQLGCDQLKPDSRVLEPAVDGDI